jgi:hypothetical protein
VVVAAAAEEEGVVVLAGEIIDNRASLWRQTSSLEVVAAAEVPSMDSNLSTTTSPTSPHHSTTMEGAMEVPTIQAKAMTGGEEATELQDGLC